jgi:hypothetical protein
VLKEFKVFSGVFRGIYCTGTDLRVEYLLNSTSLHSSDIYLNGMLLQLDAEDKLPDLNGQGYNNGSPIRIDPLTYGFIHFPKSENKLCMS